MIKAVSFDFWFTICTTNVKRDARIQQLRDEAIYAIYHKYNYSRSFSDFQSLRHEADQKIKASIIARNYRDYSIKDRIKHFYDFTFKKLDGISTPSISAYEELLLLNEISIPYTEMLLREIPKLNLHIREALNYLSDQNIQIGIISNTGKSPGSVLKQVLKSYGILSYFKSVVFSNEVGLSKPNLDIFHRMVSDFKVFPKEILHIGDSIYPDVIAAQQAGFHAALYLGAYQDSFSYHPSFEEDIQIVRPPYIIDDFRDFPELIDHINEGKPIFRKYRNLMNTFLPKSGN